MLLRSNGTRGHTANAQSCFLAVALVDGHQPHRQDSATPGRKGLGNRHCFLYCLNFEFAIKYQDRAALFQCEPNLYSAFMAQTDMVLASLFQVRLVEKERPRYLTSSAFPLQKRSPASEKRTLQPVEMPSCTAHSPHQATASWLESQQV